MKKILAMVLSLAIVASLAISGTVAYLTDDESAVNTMTVGKVDIVLHEDQRERDDKNQPIPDGNLEEFEQNKNLMPLNGSAQGEKDDWGLVNAKNYVDKIVRVENIGESPAYVRIFVGVPAALEGATSSENVLHWNYGNRFDYTKAGKYSTGAAPTNSPYELEFPDDATAIGQQLIDGITYNIYRFTRSTPLVADAGDLSMTAAPFVGFYLDSRVDYDDHTEAYYLGEKVAEKRITVNGVGITDETVPSFNFDNGIKIPVFAQAVQADGFESAQAAFDAAFDTAFYKEYNYTYNPWTDGEMKDDRIPEPGSTIKTTEELLEKLANPKTTGILNLAAGTFTISKNEVLKILNDGITLRGAGIDKTILETGPTNVSEQAGLYIDAENVTVSDMTIKNSSDIANVAVIKVSGYTYPPQTVKNVTLKNLKIVGSKGHGINLHGVEGARVSNVNITAYGKCGISLANAKNVVIANTIIAAGGWGNDIGCMYANNGNYETPCTFSFDANCQFGNGVVYSERPSTATGGSDTCTSYPTGWTKHDNPGGNYAWVLTK